jgi:SOS-response transcriptional repressor LexA
MNTGGLTPHQGRALLFIAQRIAADGFAPSFNEIRISQGLVSKSGVHRLVRGLAERGFVRYTPGKTRSIEVVRWPAEVAPSPDALHLLSDEAFAALRLAVEAEHRERQTAAGIARADELQARR